MAILVHNIALGLDEPEDSLAARAAGKLGVAPEAIASLRVARRSFDARPRHRRWIYSLVIECADEAAVLRTGGRDARPFAPPTEPAAIPRGSATLDHPPIVIGAGPAGLFAAALLAECGYRPLVLERGADVDTRHDDLKRYLSDRVLNPQSNLLFGEGGAGTYSDGKLYTRTHDGLAGWVLQRFAQLTDDPDLAVRARPHVGSDRLAGVCRRLRQQITGAGGTVRYGACVDGLTLDGPRVASLHLADGQTLPASQVVLAVGHSARDTYRMLAGAGVSLSARAFQMGLRIEHPQALIDRAQLGDLAGRADLTPADYHLVAHARPDVYSFCMCPGGRVLPANHQPGTICSNGGSLHERDSGWANSGIVTTVGVERFGDDPLAGIAMQERIERACFDAAGGDYTLVAQRVRDFVAGRPSRGEIATSSLTGAAACDITPLLPPFITAAIGRALPMFDKRIPGFAGDAAVLIGPETRASGPVRIDRDRETRSSVSAGNLLPVGEGAGYAGGIVSAAVDALRSAQAIIARCAPMN